MIRINVFIQVSENNRMALLQTAKDLVASSLKDEGCIAYDIFESATRPDVLMICETWMPAKSRPTTDPATAPTLAQNDRLDTTVETVAKVEFMPALIRPPK